MDTISWLSCQLKRPAWLFSCAKFVIVVAALLAVILLVAGDLPNSAAQPWWWNIH